jgi:hypothetical protein
MAESPERFAQLLTEAIHRIRRCEGKRGVSHPGIT